MSLTVLSPGSLSSVQDMGRMGHQKSGVSPSGAADIRALKDLNLLLGNDEGEAAIEMTLAGMTVRFNCDCVFAVTGAFDAPKLNGKDAPFCQAAQAKAGDVLAFSFAQDGARTYFGVAGGFDIPLSMGSRSTGMKFQVGGYLGRKLQADDEIGFREEISTLPDMEKRKLDTERISQDITLRVISGPQDDRFTEKEKELFFSSVYQVSANADRMGIRLDGPEMALEKGSDIISDATANGAIQIVSEGLPIILLQDRQTTGGYAKIGCVITTDLPKAGQLLPGARVRFVPVTVKEAQQIFRRQEKAYRKLYRKINGRIPG